MNRGRDVAVSCGMIAMIVFGLSVSFVKQGAAAQSNIIDALNKILSSQVPSLNSYIASHAAPASMGQCNAESAPAPCDCISGSCGPLFYQHKVEHLFPKWYISRCVLIIMVILYLFVPMQKWEYKATAYWLSGLNSGVIDNAMITSIEDGKVHFQVKGHFANIPLRLRIEECFTFDRCSKLWDNSYACCGTNKHFVIDAVIDCQSSYPYLQKIALQSFALDDLSIDEKALGIIMIKVADITSSVHSAIQTFARQALSNPHLIDHHGQNISIVDFVNIEIQKAIPGFIFPCSASKQQASSPFVETFWCCFFRFDPKYTSI